MPYHFWIPAEDGELVQATLTEQGELFLHDYDLEIDEAMVSLGDDPSLVWRVLEVWKEDPMELLCGKHRLLPLRDNGLAAWAWARLAVDTMYPEQEEHALLEHALTISFSALTKTRLPFKKLVVARKDIANLIAEKSSIYRGPVISTRKGAVLSAVKSLLDGIIGTVKDEAYSGQPSQNVTAFCDVWYGSWRAKSSGTALAYSAPQQYDDMVIAAITLMGNVQEAERAS